MKLVLFVLLLSSSMAMADSLICKVNAKGEHQPYNVTKKEFIGISGFSLADAGDCKKSIAARGSNSVCMWDGDGYRPYSISEAVDDNGRIGYKTLEFCMEATRADVAGVVCDWNGTSFVLFVDQTGLAVSGGGGYSQYAECFQSSKGVAHGEICNWDGSNEAVYDLNTGEEIATFGDSTSACLSYLKNPTGERSSPQGTLLAWVDKVGGTCGLYSESGKWIKNFANAGNCRKAYAIYSAADKKVESTFHAVVDGQDQALIPEVISMPDGGTITPALLKKYSVNLIAASLVRRLNIKTESADHVANPPTDYMKDTLIQMRFHDRYIADIITKGFLNLHQTQHSGGLADVIRRANVENSLMGLYIEDPYSNDPGYPLHTLYPKYSFLTYKVDKTGDQSGDFVNDYGNMVAVFKDEIKQRSTFLGIDALNGDISSNGVDIDYSLDEPHTFFYRPATPVPRRVDAAGTKYWEAQIWGAVSVKDVDYFLSQCPGDDAPSAKSLELLKTLQIPIYHCAYLADHSHFAKGAVIYHP